MAGAGWSSDPGTHRGKKGGAAARDEEHVVETPGVRVGKQRDRNGKPHVLMSQTAVGKMGPGK